MTGTVREGRIRRFVLALSAASLVVIAAPLPSSAALSLALARSDYPQGARITTLPATDRQTDLYFGPVHRSSFERLHRIDGAGWIQAAVWRFKTGAGGARATHPEVFAYSINLFRTGRQARQAVHDVKVKTVHSRVAHLGARRFESRDAHQTLIFLFFAYHEVEVEAYLEYRGTAPAAIERLLRHDFSKQASHLVSFARKESRAVHATPTATATAVPSVTATATATATITATPTPTATALPTATSAPTVTEPPPTATPTPTATAVPTVPPTATPAPTMVPTSTGLVVTAMPGAASYEPGALATIHVHVTVDRQPVVGASVDITFFFTGQSVSCLAQTDASGNAECEVMVPREPGASQVGVQVMVTDRNQNSALVSLTITINRPFRSSQLRQNVEDRAIVAHMATTD